MKIAIVIPTYNEAANIPELFARLSATTLTDAQVVIVDDASPDGTAELAGRTACRLPVTVLKRIGVRGLGGAIIHGMRHALAEGADVVVTMDADLSHAPDALPALIAALGNGTALVIGSRRVVGGSVAGWSAVRNSLSRCAGFISRILLGLKTHDVTSGLRAYSASFLRTLDFDSIRSRGYAFQEEMVLRAERSGVGVREVPIHFVDRKAGASKLSPAEAFGSTISLIDLRWGSATLAWVGFAILAAVALALRLAISSAPGSEYDLWAFSWWAKESTTRSFLQFFADRRDGPILTFPNYALYFPFLALLGAAADSTIAAGRILLKLPSIFADLVVGGVLFIAFLKEGRRRAFIAASFFLFNPAVWYTSAVWGQTDIFHALFMLFAVLALVQKKFVRVWIFAVLAVFFKLQAIALVPLLAAVHLRTMGGKRFVRELIPAGVLAVLLTLPYVIATSISSVVHSFFSVVGKFPLVTMNVWGPWMLVEQLAGRFIYDDEKLFGPVAWLHIGLLVYGLVIVTVLHLLPKRPSRATIVAAACLLCFAFFLFPTEIHERYLFPFLPLIVLLIFEGWLPALIACVMSVSIFLNINLIEPWNPTLHTVASFANGAPWIVINLAAFAALFVWYRRRAVRDTLAT